MEKYSEENLTKIIKESLNKSDVLKKLGNKLTGGNFNTLSKYIMKYNIDISHFEENNKKIYSDTLSNIDRKLIYRDINEILTEKSCTNNVSLKNRLYNPLISVKKIGEFQKYNLHLIQTL